MMKKLLPALLLYLPLVTVAEPVRQINNQRDMCQAMLQGGAFNLYLEKTCGFNGGVSSKLAQISARQCADIFTDREGLALSEEAIHEGTMRFEGFDKSRFCSANRQGYNDAGRLADDFLKRNP